MGKKQTFIYCPGHPRATSGDGIIPAGMVRASDHGECTKHGNVSIPRAGTQALKDSRGLWIPGGTNLQVEHESGRVDAIIRPDTIRVTSSDLLERGIDAEPLRERAAKQEERRQGFP